jgi:nucleoside-diphosphate-sugar epimerase
MNQRIKEAMNVCVVGGTRYFGALLIDRLVAAGHHVTVVNRGRSSDSLPSSIRRLRADANDVDALGAVLDGQRFDVVVHQMIYSPVAALAAVAAFKGRTGRLIMTSTIEVYAGKSSPPGGWPERDLDPHKHRFELQLPWLDAQFADANYGRGKREAEAALIQNASMPVSIVRVGHVLALGEFTGRLDWFSERVRRGSAIADGPPSSYVHADDIAQFFAWLVEHPIDGVVNASSQPPLTPRDITAAIRGAGGTPTVEGVAELSPFHYEGPFVMSTSRVAESGYFFRPSLDWLAELADDHA